MKKLVSLITVTVMVISTLAVNVKAVEYGEELINQPTKIYTQKFSDVPSSHWAFSYIGEMAERGVIDGYMDNTFKPENNVTRAEFAKIMVAASGLPITKPVSKDFYDVEVDSWYAPYIHAAYPYLNGYAINGNQYYTPDVAAVREDIAVALVKLKGYDTDGVDENVLTSMFTDVSSISSKAKKYIAIAVTRGLVSGYDDNTFRGQASITRAEATAMLWRAFQYGNDNKTFDTTQNTQASVTETPIASPVPTAAPTTIVTQKPTVSPVPTTKTQVTPTPIIKSAENNSNDVMHNSSEQASKGNTYVVDTIAKAKINDEWNLITSDYSRYVYYVDSDNVMYSLDMEKEQTNEMFDFSDLKLTEDGFITDEPDDETSYYYDLAVDQLAYDDYRSRVMCKCHFTYYKDWKEINASRSGSDSFVMIFDGDDVSVYPIDSKENLIGNKDGDLLTVRHLHKGNGVDESYDYFVFSLYDLEKSKTETLFQADGYNNDSYKLFYYIDNEIYRQVFYNGMNPTSDVARYNFTLQSWDWVYNPEMPLFNKFRLGYHDKKFYSWNMNTGEVISCGLNGKKTLLDVNSRENIDILDFKNISPDYGRFFVSDSDKIVFYDNTATSMRVIKAR